MAVDNIQDDREVFACVGGFRSGSTLLINLLGLHPSVSVWYETKFLCEALRWMKVLNGSTTEEFEEQLIVPRNVRGFTLDAVAERMRTDMEFTDAQVAGRRASGKAGHERYPIGPDHVNYSLQEALDALDQWRQESASQAYENVAAATARLIRQLGAKQLAGRQGTVLINKTPEISRFGTELRDCLGSCRIIHLIRDGREVAASASGLQWGDVYRMAEMWCELIRQSRLAATADPTNYLELRYEELVMEPAIVADRVFTMLDLERQGLNLVEVYEKQTGLRIAAETRACDPSSRALLDQMPAAACELLEELGYVDTNSLSDLPGRGNHQPIDHSTGGLAALRKKFARLMRR